MTVRVSLIAAAVALIAGCGDASHADRAVTVSGGTTPSTTVKAAAPVRAAGQVLSALQAKAAIPAVSELPTGWSLDPDKTAGDDGSNDKSTVSPARCKAIFDQLDKSNRSKPVAKAEGDFKAGELGPFMSVTVDSYREARQSPTFADATRAFSNCRSFTATDSSGPTTFNVVPLSFPNLGDETIALRLTGKSQGINFTADVVSVHIQHNYIGVIGIGILSNDTAALEKAARVAVSRLPKR